MALGTWTMDAGGCVLRAAKDQLYIFNSFSSDKNKEYLILAALHPSPSQLKMDFTLEYHRRRRFGFVPRLNA
jgi:hypothetical protein